MRDERTAWTQTTKQTKASHWREYLDKASSGKLWKAVGYTEPRDNYASILHLSWGRLNSLSTKTRRRYPEYRRMGETDWIQLRDRED